MKKKSKIIAFFVAFLLALIVSIDAADCTCKTTISHTFLGIGAGTHNTTGKNNTFLGVAAGTWNTSGYSNTFIGHSSGFCNTRGISNTFIGYYSGFSNKTGSGNIFLGRNAGYNETGSNKLYVDNSKTDSPLLYGEFDNNIVAINGNLGIGTKAPGHPIVVATANNAYCSAGGVWTNGSSRAAKENIEELTEADAIAALKELNPVTFNYKVDKEDNCVGFIAEDVPELVAAKDRKGLSAMDVVAVLTKVVKEQQKTIDKLNKRIAKLEEKEENR